MEILDRFISIHGDIIAVFAILELIIIIILVVYIILNKLDEEDTRNKESHSSSHKPAKNDNYWRDEYNRVVREFNQYKNEHKAGPINRNACLNQRGKEHVDDVENVTGGTNYVFNDFEDYAKNETEKGIYVKKTTNEDGTEKIELEFNHKSEEFESESNNEPLSVPFIPRYEYLEAANGGKFRKLLPSDEKSLFRTWVENGVRKFEFHGNVDNALANFNAVFDDVCEIEGKQNGATQITNVEPGILSNQLKVEKKAIIKLT